MDRDPSGDFWSLELTEAWLKFIAKGGGRLRAVLSPGIPPSSQPQPRRGPGMDGI